jgi:hypothetical protein
MQPNLPDPWAQVRLGFPVDPWDPALPARLQHPVHPWDPELLWARQDPAVCLPIPVRLEDL